MEYSEFGGRKESNISDVDLTDKEHCILCFNDLKFFALGKCNHKNVCHTCILRLRLIIKDLKCPICKTPCDEILIAENKDITFEQFEKDLKSTLINDKDDKNVYYENGKVKAAGMKLRSLTCLIVNCNPGYQFHTLEELKKHLEIEHQKTFCKICLRGRLVFIREQRLYHTKHLSNHIQYGDPGNEKQAEILPHPWCDFCEEYYFNDLIFFDHLTRMHLTCHLCGDAHKNIYYSAYPNLETHFAWSHYLCPYESCKSKCYVSFRTEDELQAHVDIEHKARQKQIKANALLGFEYDQKKEKQFKKDKIEIKDQEGIDFSFYFSEKYNFIHERRKLNQNQQQNTSYSHDNQLRGGYRGRGRGGRGGRGGYHQEEGDLRRQESNKEEGKSGKQDEKGGATMKSQHSPKGKLALILQFLSKYIKERLEKGIDTQQEYKVAKALLYQMYFVIARLDENRLAKMEYLVNFGVTLDSIHLIHDGMEQGGDYEDLAENYFKVVPFFQLLKICKYFSWADKKLHQVFYIENKDDIQEDLLSEFKDPDNEKKFIKPQVLNKAGGGIIDKSKIPEAQQNVIVREEGLVSEIEYLLGSKKDKKKTIDVRSNQDFPTLGLGGSSGSIFSEQSSKKQKGKKFQNQDYVENDWEKNPFQAKGQPKPIFEEKELPKTKKPVSTKDAFPILPGGQQAQQPQTQKMKSEIVQKQEPVLKQVQPKKEEKKVEKVEKVVEVKKEEKKEDNWPGVQTEEKKEEAKVVKKGGPGGKKKKGGGGGQSLELRGGFY